MDQPTDPGIAAARRRILVRGAVQGMGFRPFVCREARAHGLSGWVANAREGVVMEAEGGRDALDRLLRVLREHPPRHARIDSMEVVDLSPRGGGGFTIVESRSEGITGTQMLPDLATCDACLAELFDARNRRHRYPFISCVDCGPRYSIAEAVPYDRARTSMRRFAMCHACRREYGHPQDRRFHAQTIACAECGPRIALWDGSGRVLAQHEDALEAAAQAVRAGLIVAVKGLGGFQLLADARSADAVQRLRQRKRRPSKPFALMLSSLDAVSALCEVSEIEAALLRSPASPIVLLQRRRGVSSVCDGVAPGSPCLGIMLPCTPLHHLLLHALRAPVIATSGNLSDEPIAIDEHEALSRLHGIADLFLVHDRPILRPLDDSVARVVDGAMMLLRRARGYAPGPVARGAFPDGIVGFGGDMKATVAASIRGHIAVSQHLGELDTPQARALYQQAIHDLTDLHGIGIRHAACDAHPDYYSAARAHRHPGCDVTRVQHHVAHIAACMAEHRLAAPVLGVAWDGTGYGTDATVWGGEFLRITADGAHRIAHLRPFRLPGGERAVREPRRAAFGLLHAAYGGGVPGLRELAPVAAFSPAEAAVLANMCARGVNAPLTTSVGRLFDAVASLTGICQQSRHEGEAACALEWAIPARRVDDVYRFAILDAGDGSPLVIDWAPVVDAILSDLKAGVAAGMVSVRFHNGLAQVLIELARRAGEPVVVLSGGCFQNRYLLVRAIDGLRAANHRPCWPQALPPHDGALSVGQVAWAAGMMSRERG